MTLLAATPESDRLAKKVAKSLSKNHTHTINLLASENDALMHEIEDVLDSYAVTYDNKGKPSDPTFVGPGQGGGWIPEEERKKLVVGMERPNPEMLGEHIGWRWPDGKLHEEIFDPTNPAHLEELELEPPTE